MKIIASTWTVNGRSETRPPILFSCLGSFLEISGFTSCVCTPKNHVFMRWLAINTTRCLCVYEFEQRQCGWHGRHICLTCTQTWEGLRTMYTKSASSARKWLLCLDSIIYSECVCVHKIGCGTLNSISWCIFLLQLMSWRPSFPRCVSMHAGIP